MINDPEPWTLPKFYFQVEWNSQKIVFQEISGLNMEEQLIEYCNSNKPAFSTVKMPGIKKTGSVTLKKGVLKNNDQFCNWYKAVNINTIKKTTITINLMDELGSPITTWILNNAFPIKITGTDLKANDNEIAIESIEIMHEGITKIN